MVMRMKSDCIKMDIAIFVCYTIVSAAFPQDLARDSCWLNPVKSHKFREIS